MPLPAARSVKRRLWAWVIISVLSVACGWLIARSGLLLTLESRTVDWRFQLRGVRPSAARGQIAVVAIDDHTLDAIDKPLVFWGAELGTALARLHRLGAVAVGVDMLQATPLEPWLHQENLVYAQALSAQPDVVLISMWHDRLDGTRELIEPMAQLKYALPDPDTQIGYCDLLPDRDGCIRTAHLVEPASNPPLVSFMLQVARHAWHGQAPATPEMLPINYVGPPRTFTDLHFADLVGAVTPAREAALRREVAGKIVLIGATYSGCNDFHFTPFYHHRAAAWNQLDGSGRMAGIEIHANILATLLDNCPLRAMSRWNTALLLLLLAAICCGGWFFLRPWVGIVLQCGVMGGWMIGAVLLFHRNLVMDVTWPLLAMSLAFAGSTVFQYITETRHRHQVTDVLGRFVSRGVADQLVAEGATVRLSGARVEITVLVSDLRGFSTFCETADEHQVVALLNTYFRTLVPIILRYGGTIDKYIGDAIMAVFGAPLEMSDHQARALCCAIEMRQAIHELQRQWAAQGIHGADFGIGLFSGPAIAGVIGVEERMEYSVLGQTVNLAFRTEAANSSLGTHTLISESLALALREHIAVQGPFPVQVKKTHLEVYELLTTEVPAAWAHLGQGVQQLAKPDKRWYNLG